MEPPSRPVVHILDPHGYQPSAAFLQQAVALALSSKGFGQAEVSVLLSTDEHVRDLNRDFRDIDEPTDVLTFPDVEGSGDIAIAVPYARKQASKRGVPLDQELAYLAIHGALHLAGLDDRTDEERSAMVAEMNGLARCLGIPEDHGWGSILHEEAA